MPLNVSIPIENTVQVLEGVSISPLISRCKVKVCYVGKNRNGSFISKALAEEMGRKLPGSPVVGFFNEKTQDFDEHSREVTIKAGEFKVVDITRPYGFVPTDAHLWFQTFNDNGVEHEYLCTECYLWTEIYPECKHATEQGNNQSMELTKDSGNWANGDNPNERIFIYNEALIEKLCILGSDVEPCFEGSQITSFSLGISKEDFDKLQTNMYSKISELQAIINKGGSHDMDNTNPQVTDTQETVIPTGGITINVNNPPSPEFKKKDNEAPQNNNGEQQEQEQEDKKKKQYNLDEIPEYQELLRNYSELETKFNNLQTEKSTLETEIAGLREYKLTADRKEKQEMINSFFMLSEEDKKEVTDNIDQFSVQQIEEKLSVACFRKKVNFGQEPQQQEPRANNDGPAGMFNLNNNSGSNNLPAWIQAVQNSTQN